MGISLIFVTSFGRYPCRRKLDLVPDLRLHAGSAAHVCSFHRRPCAGRSRICVFRDPDRDRNHLLPEEVIRKRNEYLQAEARRQRQHADEELQLNGKPMDFTEEQRIAYGSLSDEERQRLQGILEKYKDNAVRNPGLYDNFIHSIFTRSFYYSKILTSFIS